MSNTTTTETRRRRPLGTLPPTETLEIGGGLSLSPRLKLQLTFFRADLTVRPLDEWKLKQALLSFLRSPPLSLSRIPDEDLLLNRLPDLQKRKRDESVATGTLYVRDISFLKPSQKENADEEDEGMVKKRFLDWREEVVEKLSGIELNIEGVKFKMAVELPIGDDLEKMKKSWEDFYASNRLDKRNFMRNSGTNRNTIIVRGVPSRWFAEPRVSSKASMLVTHTIFSVFGKIRNINVAGDDDRIKDGDETKSGINLSGLNCKIWVQFETYEDFYGAMNVLCGRSMQKEGSRLKVDYEVTWDRDNFFKNTNTQQKPVQNQSRERGGERKRDLSYLLKNRERNGVHNRESPYKMHAESARRKRFKD